MKLLDLFCGAGGCAEGYNRAGFDDITGIDIEPQKRYPFRFIKGDALEYLGKHGHQYDMVHASPPCQGFSIASARQRKEGKQYENFLSPCLSMLINSGNPFVVENVPERRW